MREEVGGVGMSSAPDGSSSKRKDDRCWENKWGMRSGPGTWAAGGPATPCDGHEAGLRGGAAGARANVGGTGAACCTCWNEVQNV